MIYTLLKQVTELLKKLINDRKKEEYIYRIRGHGKTSTIFTQPAIVDICKSNHCWAI